MSGRGPREGRGVVDDEDREDVLSIACSARAGLDDDAIDGRAGQVVAGAAEVARLAGIAEPRPL